MALMNYTTMQITAKIVYYGPGLCGKTSNLQWIHQKTAERSRGEMLSLETETDRTLFFDLLPLDVGVIGGMKVRLQLYTVPGQVFYNTTRRLVLKGVDGIVFVADSQEAAFDANRESLANLDANLAEQDLSRETVPIVFQYNKRDIRKITPLEDLQAALNPQGAPYFEAAALHGLGVFETLKAISRLALGEIKKKITAESQGQRPPARPPKAAVAALTASAPPAPEPAAPEPPLPPPAAPPPSPVPLEATMPTTDFDDVLSRILPTPPAEETPSHLEVEFAEEDTGKHVVRPVQMKGALDIQAELAKLRALTTSAPSTRPARARSREADRLFEGLAAARNPARLELKRKASVEVSEDTLKKATDVRLHVAFVAEGGEQVVTNAVIVKLNGQQALEKLTLRLDLEIKGKK
jgi:signal recognition particle receptor subunit beta